MATKVNKSKVIAAAQKYVQKGQYDKAIREYAKIVEEDPRDVRIWLKIGDLQAKKNASQEAVETYSKVAEFYSEQGFYLKAVAVYKQILKIDSTLVDVNLRLAELYKQLGLLNDAMQQYEQVSNVYHQAGRTKDALDAQRQVVDLDPQNVARRIKLAELYSKEAMRDEAVQEFAKAADYLRAENRVDDFVKVAERLVYHQPENLPITKELAGIYLRKQDPRRALQKLQLAFKADPRDAATLEMLAQAFEDLGQVPKTISVLKELANIHGENGQEAKQRAIYERILALAPSDEDALRGLGRSGSRAASAPRAQAPAPYTYQQNDYQQNLGAAEPLQGDAGDPYQEPATPYGGARAAAQPRAQTASVPYGASEEPYRPTYEEPAPAFASSVASQAPEHLDEDDAAQIERLYHAERTRQPYASTELEARVAKIIKEVDVYLKYGLHDKAISHLRQVFDSDPRNVDVHLKLREIFGNLGRQQEAAQELYALAQIYSEADRQAAVGYLREALGIAPEYREARSLLSQLDEGTAGEAASPFEDSFLEEVSTGAEPIDLDAGDIVEEIPIDSAEVLEPAELIAVDDTNGDHTQPGGEWTASYGGDGFIDESGVRSDTLAGVDNTGLSGVIEVYGETVDTLGGGTPSAEVIALGGPLQRADSQIRAHLEEESSRIEDDLEEAEFFIQQNLLSEARAILEEISRRMPHHPLVKSKLAELMSLEQQVEEPASSAPTQQESVPNLAEELADDFDQVSDQLKLLDAPPAKGDYSVEEVFDEFKRGVEAQTSDEDSDTHYDLGIAYREMGLYDDAISEFKVAMRGRDKEVLCHMMIGLCYMEKEMLSEAISQFKTGLYVEGITERETIALYFELGQAYEHLDDLREALYYFEKVAKREPRFRDVSTRVEQIRLRAENPTPHVRLAKSGGGNPGGGGKGDVLSSKVV